MTRVNTIECDLEGRVVLMTGADRGLGRAMSPGLAEKRARVTARGRYQMVSSSVCLSDAFAAARQRFVSRALHI
jgi:NAD(P)-dependent dehydrogenase (short-subunit alcohol dehydrogenase family)